MENKSDSNYNDLVSIVVPIYNVELYIDDCINTLINQTYKKIEIILVDDGSTDNSQKICEEYAKQDSRIKVLHKENGGLSDARNKGLDVAQGKYIIFVDSDDFVNIYFVEKLYKSCVQNESDISVCKYQEIKSKKEAAWKKQINSNNRTMTGREYIIDMYNGESEKLGFVAWNKIYKKDLFINNNIRYPKGKYYEDTFTTFRLLYTTKKITVINDTLYYYRIREGSIMTSSIDLKKVYDGIEADIYNAKFYDKENDDVLLALSLNYFYRETIELYYNIEKMNKEAKKFVLENYLQYWRVYHNKLHGKIINEIKYYIFYYMFLIINKMNRG